MFAIPTMICSAKIYSRIGELLQGFLPDGDSFLVSGLPSTQFYSEAVLKEEDLNLAASVLPHKARQALLQFREAYNLTTGDTLTLEGKTLQLSSNIQRSKGLSSSSA